MPVGQKETATLRTLNSFAVDLISIPNVEDLFWYVAQNVVGRLGFVDCVIYRADDAQTTLVQVAAMGEKNPFGRSIVNPLKIPFGEGITGQVAKTVEAIIIDDLLMDQNYIEDTQAARSEICVPLISGNRVVGVIDSEHPQAGAFGAAEMEVLTTIAAMTSAKLDLLAEAERSSQRYHELVAAHAQISLEATNRKALEAELFGARKLEVVGRLTGRFAHEFNNLLTVISGNLEFLEDFVDEPPFDENLRDAQIAARRGATLIQSMLAYSKRTKLTPKKMCLTEIVTDIIARMGRMENISFVPHASTAAVDVSVDPEMLEAVLLQLISNASDATPPGREICITSQRIKHKHSDKRQLATALLPGPYICLSVQDRGAGMAAKDLQQIFDPFYTTKPVGSGTGLGLSMTLGFMQQSGGTVAVHSVVGEGSTFQLYFPSIAFE
jgi:signal transduction histidine kinase